MPIYRSEQSLSDKPTVSVSINAIAASETNVLHLNAANTRYIIESMRIKAANPGAETVTIKLYELVAGVLVNTDSFAIDATNFATNHSLMDMFGLASLSGDQIKVTVQMSGGAAVAITGQYSYATSEV